MDNSPVKKYSAEIWQFIFEQEPPRLLYHYTSSAGVLGMLESATIWASDVKALNDEKEVKHAAHVLEHAFENYLRRKGIKDEEVVRTISSQFRHFGDKVRGHCVCSFSESGDLLSQWRAYASDGRGLSIGFNARLLELDAGDSVFRLGKCIYDYDTQYRICNDFLGLALSEYDVTKFLDSFPLALQEEFEEFIYTIGLFLKHPAFIDEREWRLVSGRNHLYSTRWKYRATSRGLSAYVELPLPSIFSKEEEDEPKEHTPHFQFTLGPKARRTPTNYILQALSHRVLGKGYGVSQSGVPYID